MLNFEFNSAHKLGMNLNVDFTTSINLNLNLNFFLNDWI